MPRLSGSFRVGKLTVVAISDGAEEGPRQRWFNGIDPAVLMPALGISSPDISLPANFGGFVVTGDGHVTLIDTGFGLPGQKRAGTIAGGRMLERLAELGIRPADVDRIMQTHLHFDHCGWLIEDDGGKLTFPNATVYLHRRELEYWTSAESDDNRLAAFARSRIEPVCAAGRVQVFDREFALSEALTALPTPGHTPGHSSVLLTSDGDHALLLGDVAHHPIHLDHPDWVPEIDLDPHESIRSRRKMAALAVERNALVTAPHMPILTLCRVRRAGRGYTYEIVQAGDN
jgi:glyoxylase-like metal-dependent hydrolase (beta-lactamase superfamily II)